jgi:hypothetical protein
MVAEVQIFNPETGVSKPLPSSKNTTPKPLKATMGIVIFVNDPGGRTQIRVNGVVRDATHDEVTQARDVAKKEAEREANENLKRNLSDAKLTPEDNSNYGREEYKAVSQARAEVSQAAIDLERALSDGNSTLVRKDGFHDATGALATGAGIVLTVFSGGLTALFGGIASAGIGATSDNTRTNVNGNNGGGFADANFLAGGSVSSNAADYRIERVGGASQVPGRTAGGAATARWGGAVVGSADSIAAAANKQDRLPGSDQIYSFFSEMSVDELDKYKSQLDKFDDAIQWLDNNDRSLYQKIFNIKNPEIMKKYEALKEKQKKYLEEKDAYDKKIKKREERKEKLFEQWRVDGSVVSHKKPRREVPVATVN